MTTVQLQELARVGAEARLRAIGEEREALLQAFPDLGNATSLSSRTSFTARSASPTTAGRKRSGMSPASAKPSASGMKAYWAKRRGESYAAYWRAAHPVTSRALLFRHLPVLRLPSPARRSEPENRESRKILSAGPRYHVR